MNNPPPTYAKFAVGKRAKCVWGRDVVRQNLDFLNGLDPGFFGYLASAYGPPVVNAPPSSDVLDTRRAVALRLAYGVASEALFSLIGAMIQAPHCVFGWLGSYQNVELRQLVEKIQTGGKVLAHPDIRPLNWFALSTRVHETILREHNERGRIAAAKFADFWGRLATDYLQELGVREYNSLKHGFRVLPGGFSASTGIGDDSLTIAESTGHTFFSLEALRPKASHYSVRQHSLPLQPERYRAALPLISDSLNNLICFLRGFSGETENLVYRFPDDPGVFDVPWKTPTSLLTFNFGETFDVSGKHLWSDEEILAIYGEEEG